MITNTGDAPLTITALAILADALDVGAANDFAVVSQNCTGTAPLAASTLVRRRPGHRGRRDGLRHPARHLHRRTSASGPPRSAPVRRAPAGHVGLGHRDRVDLAGRHQHQQALGSVGGDVAQPAGADRRRGAELRLVRPGRGPHLRRARHGDGRQHRRRREAVGLRPDTRPLRASLVNGTFALPSPLHGPRDQRGAAPTRPTLRGRRHAGDSAHLRRPDAGPTPSRWASARRSAPPTRCAPAATARR